MHFLETVVYADVECHLANRKIRTFVEVVVEQLFMMLPSVFEVLPGETKNWGRLSFHATRKS